jgi:hypothetical protein
MTDILASIDDTLAEPSVFTAPAAGWYEFGANVWHLPDGQTLTMEFVCEPVDAAPKVPVSTLYDRWLQHRICAAYGLTRAQIGLEGPSFLDARYRQRQRNRRRRKR